MSDPAATADPEGPRSTQPSPRNRLAAEMRRISAVTVGRYIDREAYEAAASTVAAVADALEAAAETGKRPRGMPDPKHHPQDFFPGSPVIGYANPISPPVDVWAVEGENGLRELRGRARYDYQYEGPPTCVHGGVIAQLFDELLGSINILNDEGGFTGTLTIRYRRPTPLLTDLDLEARQTRREGRKLFAWGCIRHNGEVTAEAEGIFIKVIPEQMASIVSANSRKADGEVVDGEWAEIIAEAAVPDAAQTARSRPSQ